MCFSWRFECDFMQPQYLKYVVKSNEKEADRICTVRLEPLEGEAPQYEAGQFFMIKNTNLPLEIKPKIKPYSALHIWRANELSFGIKIHAQFSTGMSVLEAGQEIECAGPYGFFVLPKEVNTPLVFLAGGIGITPLITMIEKLALSGHSEKYYLFYSNREEKDVAYKKELDELADLNENFELVYFMTGSCQIDAKNCEMGRISIEMIKKYVSEFDSAHFYMCAGKEFLESMQKNLADSGVLKERVHVEKW